MGTDRIPWGPVGPPEPKGRTLAAEPRNTPVRPEPVEELRRSSASSSHRGRTPLRCSTERPAAALALAHEAQGRSRAAPHRTWPCQGSQPVAGHAPPVLRNRAANRSRAAPHRSCQPGQPAGRGQRPTGPGPTGQPRVGRGEHPTNPAQPWQPTGRGQRPAGPGWPGQHRRRAYNLLAHGRPPEPEVLGHLSVPKRPRRARGTFPDRHIRPP